MAITGFTINGLVDSNGNVVDGTPPFEYTGGETVFLSVDVKVDSAGQYKVGTLIDGQFRDSESFSVVNPTVFTVDVPFSSSTLSSDSYTISVISGVGTVTSDSFNLRVAQPDIGSISNLDIGGQGSTATITKGDDVPIAFDVDVNTQAFYGFTVATKSGTQIGSTTESLSIGVQTVTISSSESNTGALPTGTFTVVVSVNGSPASVSSVDGLVVSTSSIQLSINSGSDADVGGSLSLTVQSGRILNITANDADAGGSLSLITQSGEILSITANDADAGGSLNTSLLTGTALGVRANDADVSKISLRGDIVPPDVYVIDGLFLKYQSEVRSSDEIEWTFVTTQRYLALLQPLLDQAGEVSVVEKIDGGFESVDRSNGKATFPVTPPSGRGDVRSVDTWLIRSYEVEYLSSDGKQMLVTLVASPEREKTGAESNPYSTIDNPPDLSDADDQWFFEFEYGEVLTSRVTSNLSSSSDAQLQVYSLELIVTPNEVRRIEESCGLSASVTVREIPDGSNFVSADTDGSNVVFISPPTTVKNDIDTGDYAVLSWETEYNRGGYVVTLEVVKA